MRPHWGHIILEMNKIKYSRSQRGRIILHLKFRAFNLSFKWKITTYSKLFFNSVSIDSENLLNEKIPYKKYELGVVGEAQNNQLKFYRPNDSIIIYTLDDFVYASNEYAKYVSINNAELFTILKA